MVLNPVLFGSHLAGSWVWLDPFTALDGVQRSFVQSFVFSTSYQDQKHILRACFFDRFSTKKAWKVEKFFHSAESSMYGVVAFFKIFINMVIFCWEAPLKDSHCKTPKTNPTSSHSLNPLWINVHPNLELILIIITIRLNFSCFLS